VHNPTVGWTWLARAVVSLLVVRELVGSRTPDNSAVATTERADAPKPLRWPLVSCLVIVAVAAGVGGWRLIPQDDSDEPTLKHDFVIGAPFSLSSSSGPLVIERVAWIESHGEDPNSMVPPFTGAAQPQPSVEPGHTRGMVVVKLDGASDDRVPIEIRVDLPPSATLSGCYGFLYSEPDCTEQFNSAFEVSLGRSQRYVSVTGIVGPGSNGFGAALDFTGISGMNFVENRTRAVVRFPQVYAFEISPRDIAAIGGDIDRPWEVGTAVLVPDPSAFTWSERPQAVAPNMAGWFFETGDRFSAPPGAVTGVKEIVLRNDSNNNFWSGLLLGIAGGAVVATLEAVLGDRIRTRRRPVR
jgi:hypothetical protein